MCHRKLTIEDLPTMLEGDPAEAWGWEGEVSALAPSSPAPAAKLSNNANTAKASHARGRARAREEGCGTSPDRSAVLTGRQVERTTPQVFTPFSQRGRHDG